MSNLMKNDGIAFMNTSMNGYSDHPVFNQSTFTAVVDNSIIDGMNHSFTAGGEMAMKTCTCGMMQMYFHFGTKSIILFDEWRTIDVLSLVLSMLAIFIVAVVFEGLKYYRQYLSRKTNKICECPPKLGMVESQTKKVNKPKMCSTAHMCQTLLHIVQFVISYCLMLIFMTYNVWLCLAVAWGAGAGYFLFGWRKFDVVDVTEHCH